MILIAGGDRDPNIEALIRRIEARRMKCRVLSVGAQTHPAVLWQLNDDRLTIDGEPIAPSGVFIRYDVFTNMADRRPESTYRAHAWYTTVVSWARAHSSVRHFNRAARDSVLKPHQLHLAAQLGMRIPYTLITNDLDYLDRESERRELVTKPVNGGDYCQELGPILLTAPRRQGRAAAPAIVQEKLVQPDVRIYRVGPVCFTFKLVSDALDYRTSTQTRVEEIETPCPDLVAKVRALTDAMGLDFAATDFKAAEGSGDLLFLEVNSAPMFLAFDAACEGRLCDAMIDFLSAPGASGEQVEG